MAYRHLLPARLSLGVLSLWLGRTRSDGEPVGPLDDKLLVFRNGRPGGRSPTGCATFNKGESSENVSYEQLSIRRLASYC